jgi:hypothetical protein
VDPLTPLVLAPYPSKKFSLIPDLHHHALEFPTQTTATCPNNKHAAEVDAVVEAEVITEEAAEVEEEERTTEDEAATLRLESGQRRKTFSIWGSTWTRRSPSSSPGDAKVPFPLFVSRA